MGWRYAWPDLSAAAGAKQYTEMTFDDNIHILLFQPKSEHLAEDDEFSKGVNPAPSTTS